MCLLFLKSLASQDTECTDWFRECTLFQLNRQHCHGFHPPREYDAMLRKREGREFEPEKCDKEAGARKKMSKKK